MPRSSCQEATTVPLPYYVCHVNSVSNYQLSLPWLFSSVDNSRLSLGLVIRYSDYCASHHESQMLNFQDFCKTLLKVKLHELTAVK